MPSIKIYSKEQVDDLISDVTPPTVVQTTGTSTTFVMSQDAVTTALGNKADTSALPTSSQLVPSTIGASSGDVLSFNGSSTEWVTPSSSGGVIKNISNVTSASALSSLLNTILSSINDVLTIKISGTCVIDGYTSPNTITLGGCNMFKVPIGTIYTDFGGLCMVNANNNVSTFVKVEISPGGNIVGYTITNSSIVYVPTNLTVTYFTKS